MSLNCWYNFLYHGMERVKFFHLKGTRSSNVPKMSGRKFAGFYDFEIYKTSAAQTTPQIKYKILDFNHPPNITQE